MRVFIVSPLPGTKDYDIDAVKVQENRLIRVGHKPLSLRRYDFNEETSIEVMNRKVLENILEADGIMLMDESNETNGGTLPRLIAAALGIPEVKVTVLGTKWV